MPSSPHAFPKRGSIIERMDRRGIFFLCTLLLGICVARAQDVLSDEEIQKAIDSGRTTKAQTLWKNLENGHAVQINRITIVDQVGKQAVFLNDLDLIALVASDATRRHSVLQVVDVGRWRNLGATHVILVARVETRNTLGLLEWQSPAVHMTIKADGSEIQPLSQAPSESSETRSFFVTVISASGHERHKDIDVSKLK